MQTQVLLIQDQLKKFNHNTPPKVIANKLSEAEVEYLKQLGRLVVLKNGLYEISVVFRIYIIENSINNKVYIGQTCQTLNKRFNHHGNNPSCTHLFRAIKKYGKEKFSIRILCEANTQEEANIKEIEYIKEYDSFNNGYNSTSGGTKHFIHSAESIAKISQRHKGNKYLLGHKQSEKTKLKRANALRGKKRTPEQCAAISKSLIGIKYGPCSEARKEYLRQKLTGIKRSQESILKSATKRTGAKRTPEQRARMSAAHRGIPLSEEHKAKLKGRVPHNKGVPMSEETRAKLSEKLKGKVPHNKGKKMK